MDPNPGHAKVNPVSDLEPRKVELRTERVEINENESLLVPLNAQKEADDRPKTRRRVQWNDTHGNSKLAEVVEFYPSDVSDSDDDESDSCFCTIM